MNKQADTRQPKNIASTTMYAVYINPTDYPGKIVVRKWNGETPEQEPTIITTSIVQARLSIPKGLYRLPRQNGDDPCILETWI